MLKKLTYSNVVEVMRKLGGAARRNEAKKRGVHAVYIEAREHFE